jgi:hypothetical protein
MAWSLERKKAHPGSLQLSPPISLGLGSHATPRAWPFCAAQVYADDVLKDYKIMEAEHGRCCPIKDASGKKLLCSLRHFCRPGVTYILQLTRCHVHG